MQSAARGRLARRRVSTIKRKKQADREARAATKIASAARGKHARKRVRTTAVAPTHIPAVVHSQCMHAHAPPGTPRRSKAFGKHGERRWKPSRQTHLGDGSEARSAAVAAPVCLPATQRAVATVQELAPASSLAARPRRRLPMGARLGRSLQADARVGACVGAISILMAAGAAPRRSQLRLRMHSDMVKA